MTSGFKFNLKSFLYYIFNILNYIYIDIFSALIALDIWKEESPQLPPMCSIHLDDAMTLRQNGHHTPAMGGEETE